MNKKIKMIAVEHQVNSGDRYRLLCIASSHHHSEPRNIFLRYSAAACLSAASALGLLIKSYKRRVGSALQGEVKKSNTHKCLFALIPVTLCLLQLFPRSELLELSRLSSAEVI